MDKALKNYYLR